MLSYNIIDKSINEYYVEKLSGKSICNSNESTMNVIKLKLATFKWLILKCYSNFSHYLVLFVLSLFLRVSLMFSL